MSDSTMLDDAKLRFCIRSARPMMTLTIPVTTVYSRRIAVRTLGFRDQSDFCLLKGTETYIYENVTHVSC